MPIPVNANPARLSLVSRPEFKGLNSRARIQGHGVASIVGSRAWWGQEHGGVKSMVVRSLSLIHI